MADWSPPPQVPTEVGVPGGKLSADSG